MKKKSLALATLLAFIAPTREVQAAGYQLVDYSAAGLGRAYAGGGITGGDHSALAYNPAAMTLSTSGLQAGVMGVFEDGHVDGTYSSKLGEEHATTDMRAAVAIPHFFTEYKVNNDFVVGFGVYVPYGLKSTYNEDKWVATDHGINSVLEVVDYGVGFGYKLTQDLSVGVELFARDAKVELSSTNAGHDKGGRNKIEVEDWAFGANLGVMYQLTDATRVGVSYRTRTQHQLHGTSHARTPSESYEFKANIPINAPDHVIFGLNHQVNEKLSLSLGAKWTHWSYFKTLTIQGLPGGQETVLAQRWRNAWNVSVGADYIIDDNWTIRGGIGYDQSGVPNSYDRTLVICDNDRWQFATGFTYKTGNWKFDLGYMFVYMGHFEIHNDRHDLNGTPGTKTESRFDGKYNMKSHALSFAVQYDF